MRLLGAAPLLPPRPNLGPEPWPKPSPWWWIVALAASVLVSTVIAIRVMRHRKKSKRLSPVSSSSIAPRTIDHPLTAWAESVRDVLVARFGPSWAAKTTEEIAAEPSLAERLGSERAAQLVRFFHAADRAKFAGDHDVSSRDGDHGEAWAGWAEEFVGSVSRES